MKFEILRQYHDSELGEFKQPGDIIELSDNNRIALLTRRKIIGEPLKASKAKKSKNTTNKSLEN